MSDDDSKYSYSSDNEDDEEEEFSLDFWKLSTESKSKNVILKESKLRTINLAFCNTERLVFEDRLSFDPPQPSSFQLDPMTENIFFQKRK
jgi:hypothetical protein